MWVSSYHARARPRGSKLHTAQLAIPGGGVGGAMHAPGEFWSSYKFRAGMQVFPAFDQIVNEIAKYRYVSNLALPVSVLLSPQCGRVCGITVPVPHSCTSVKGYSVWPLGVLYDCFRQSVTCLQPEPSTRDRKISDGAVQLRERLRFRNVCHSSVQVSQWGGEQLWGCHSAHAMWCVCLPLRLSAM